MKNKMKKALTETVSSKTISSKTNDQKIPESVIFHLSDFRKLNRSGIVKALKLKAKKLKYRIK